MSCTVSAQKGISAHPGQDVELSCSLAEISENRQIIGWILGNLGHHGVNSILNGRLAGYSAHTHSTSIIIQNITMNDSRNGTEYQCVTITNDNVIQRWSDTVFQLYVAGE